MPCIMVRTRRTGCDFDMKGFALELAEQMDIAVERVNIVVDYFSESEAFFGSRQDISIFSVFLSETNSEAFNKQLMDRIASLAEKYLSKDKKNIAVICNQVREGHMLLNNQFK